MKKIYNVYYCDSCKNLSISSEKCTRCNLSNLKPYPNEPLIWYPSENVFERLATLLKIV